MLFCAGNIVDDDVTVIRIFLVDPVCSLRSAVCSLQSANVIHRKNIALAIFQAFENSPGVMERFIIQVQAS